MRERAGKEKEKRETEERKEEEMEDVQVVEGEEVITTTGLPRGLSCVWPEQFH